MSAQPITSGDMADANTPFIRNAWYVIAEGANVTRQPLARTVLGTSVVLFRTTEGVPVALQNRCCHRSFPLSKGRLEGDTLVCGYHGLRYDCSGRCIEIPMQKSVPSAVRVRAYTTIEKGPFLWIWMGEPARADPALLPHQDWMAHPDWDARWDYLYIRGSYVYLHENLLDLSHLSFVHAKTFGTPEYARAPVEMQIKDDDIQVWRHVECGLPPIYAEPLGWVGAKALRSSGSQFVSPGLHINTGMFRNLELSDDPTARRPTVKVAQLITPETQHTTHYWTLQARNFARADAAVSDFMIQQQMAAFREDVFVLESITGLKALEGDRAIPEISIPTDKAGVLMRRRLRKLAEMESLPGPEA